MGTTSSPVVPPCTQVLPTECRRRSSPHQSESTLSGLVAPSWLPSLPSRLCGSPSRSTTRQDHPLSTESASKLPVQDCGFLCAIFTFPAMFNLLIKANEIVHVNKLMKTKSKK